MTKAEEFILRYQIDRERYWNAKGIFRCNKQLIGEEKCIKQCYECNQYYVDKLKQNKV